MEPGCNQHNNSRYCYLYLYTFCRAVCHHDYYEYPDNFQYYPHIYADWTSLPELHSPIITCKFNKYTVYHGYMESGNNQYCRGRYCNLYLYPGCRAMCRCNNYGYCGIDQYYPDIYTDRTSMPEQHSSGTAFKFNKYTWHYRYLESGYYKYNNSWNNDLYLYSGWGAMCRWNNYGYSGIDQYYPNIYTDRTTLSEQHSPGTAFKFNKYTCHNRYVESGCHKYNNSWNNDLYLYSFSWPMCLHHNINSNC